MKKIMYVEYKGDGIDGPGRIGWVEFSKSGRSFYYQGKRLQKYKGGFKDNCYDAETGETYWVSGPKKNGLDKNYGGIVQVDEDAREEYWTKIRKLHQCRHLTQYRG